MPLDLTNASATFQGLMNEIFWPFLQKFVLIFFDDIMVYSSTREDHLIHLRMTLDVLRKKEIYAKRSKCCFGKSKVEYLGHLVSKQGVEADPVRYPVWYNGHSPQISRPSEAFWD